MSTIPASAIVSVIPGVISAGGSALDLNAVVLTENYRVPIGSVPSFPSASAVSSFFGASSAEAALAAIYFAGFDNSNVKPGALMFSQYNMTAVSGWLQGGSVASLTLAQLQALSGTIILTVGGTVFTSSSISLSSATSFSDAATLIEAGFVSPTFAVTYDSVSSGFLFTTTATGSTATITAATGTLSAGLLLTVATGATLSQGAAAIASPSAGMNAITAITTNWATFMSVFDPDAGSGNTIKLEFAAWNGTQNNRYLYVCWDSDVTPTTSNQATTSLGYILKANNTSGTMPVWETSYTKAAFICGAVASIDFTEVNGRASLAFKSQSGLTATVTNQTVASNLIANGYNFYGIYGTANDQFSFLYPGSVTGEFKWADSYINEIWLNNNFQLALMTLLTNTKSIPYNNTGYALIRAACMDPINAGLNFGAFNAGVPLSSAQAAEVNNAAGMAIDGVLSTQGYYLQILPATAATRGARTSPPMSFWYMDGGSVQQINLASIEVQ